MALLGDAPPKIVHVQERLPVSPVNAMSNYKSQLYEARQSDQPQQGTKIDKWKRERLCKI